MWKARLAAKLFPWHIDSLDKINGNALVRRWIAEQRGRIPTFDHLYDFLEFGVHKGHSIRFWSQMNRDPHSRFIGFDSRSRLVVNNDSDLYSSTLFTLASLNMLLVPGAVLILDDFSHATRVSRICRL